MVIADFLRWWYLDGWLWSVHHFFVVGTAKSFRFFSVHELLKTLFAPFRQDTLDSRNAPIGYKLQVLGGNIISRFFGFIIRSILIILGCLLAAIYIVVGAIVSVVWPLLPVALLIIPLILARLG